MTAAAATVPRSPSSPQPSAFLAGSRDLGPSSWTPSPSTQGTSIRRFTISTRTPLSRTAIALTRIGCQAKRQNSTSRWATGDDQDAKRGSLQGVLSLEKLNKIVAPVLHVKSLVLGQGTIPSTDSVLSALRACERAAGLLKNSNRPPQHSASLDSEALLSFDGSSGAAASSGPRGNAGAGTGTGTASSSPAGRLPQKPGQPPSPDSAHPASAGEFAREQTKALDSIWDTAYAIISHPNVAISQEVLGQYIRVQARLGRSETLPHVLSLYASKPMPKKAEAGGSVKYVKQNPDMPSRAVDPVLAEAALDVAIDARNLDAAVGIIENTYFAKAFIRSKLLQKALLPATCLAALPAIIYILAMNISGYQNTMEGSKATTIAFAGILTYVGFTGIIGMIATTTGNDHMKRVTWSTGSSMYKRWVREEQRAALDKVACSFGFAQSMRWGEEEGEEFTALREYVMQRGMMLDRVELIEGRAD